MTSVADFYKIKFDFMLKIIFQIIQKLSKKFIHLNNKNFNNLEDIKE